MKFVQKILFSASSYHYYPEYNLNVVSLKHNEKFTVKDDQMESGIKGLILTALLYNVYDQRFRN